MTNNDMNNIITAAAAPEQAGQRLDTFASDISDGALSRSAAGVLIDGGSVTVNGRVAKKSYKINAGDTVCITLPPPRPAQPAAADLPFDIVYDDADLCVVNKPRGLVVHPAPGHSGDTLVNGLLFRLAGQLSGVGGAERPGIVHRIDRDTSGLLLVAKNDKTHRALAGQLAARAITREYEAVVVGHLSPPEGTIDRPVARSASNYKKMAVTHDGRRAVTHYTVTESLPGYDYVICRLATGRTHQIRVHMASMGHPILGDDVYGGAGRPEFAFLNGQCLHARQIGFCHPTTGRWLDFYAHPPEVFARVLEILRRR